MFRVSDIIDLPIYSLLSNTSFKYTVKSILFDGYYNKVSYIICKEGTLKKRYQAISYDKIISLDANGIIISDYDCIERFSVKSMSLYIELDRVINKTVKNEAGDLYGVLTDIYINPLTGSITSYELSEGYFDDFVNGRRIVNIHEHLNDSIVNKEIILSQSLH